MTTRHLGVLQYLFPASSLFAVLSLAGGLYGLASPAAWAASTTSVLPSASPTPAEQAYASFAAARNFGSGVTLLSLIARGQQKASGIFLLAGMVTALTDAWIVSSFGGAEGQGLALQHAIMGAVVGAVGWGVWCSAPV